MHKVFIITGANRGLGKALVDVLIKNKNYFIISISRSLNEEQKEYSDENFYFLKTDLSDNKLSKKILVLNEIIDEQEVVFINNANVIDPIIKIGNINEDQINNVFSVNMKATILITQYLLSSFNKNKLSFINISSGAANRAIANWSLYCSSKAFIKMFFEAAKLEYDQHNFFNIDPGVMDTNMQENIRQADFPELTRFKELKDNHRLKLPEEVALEILKEVF